MCKTATVLVLTGLALSSAYGRADNLLVFAASSLADALQDIRASYESNTADRIAFNFDASSKLARQIMAGAPADLFFSADEAKMDQLQAGGFILADTRASVLSNTLVLVSEAAEMRIKQPADLIAPWCKRLALAQPDSVPAGIYAKTYLRAQGLWEELAGKVVPTENVRAALAAVSSGNADAAFVYRTDVASTTTVRVAYTVPPADAPSITYPLAVVKGTRQQEAALRFHAFLRSPVAAAVFERYGFTVLPTPPP